MSQHAEHAASANRTVLGFWIYIMTDCVLFASLFATYAVLRVGTNNGPTANELFSLPYVLVETILLLTSSFTCGLAMIALQRRDKRLLINMLLLTFTIGLIFVGLEVNEFHKLAAEGNSWTRSGFLSAYFTLVATHGLHISFGLLWLIMMVMQIAKKGLGGNTVKRLALFSIFWHFLDVVWIFIFSVVYLWGSLL